MARKIFVQIRDDKREYAETIEGEDLSSLEADFAECQGSGANPQLEKLTFNEWTKTITCLFLNEDEFKSLNGTHFIYGWVENFLQSENVMPWMLKAEKLRIDTHQYFPKNLSHKVVPWNFIVIENDPNAKPWKNHAYSRFRDAPPRIYIEIWDWSGEPDRDCHKKCELGESYQGKSFDIVDGKVVEVESKYSWHIFGMSYSSGDFEWLKKNCKKCGLKYTIFDSIVKANQYCVSLGYPRIGDVYASTPHFEPLTDDEQWIRVYEKWDHKAGKVIARSLQPLEKKDMPI